MKNFFNNYKNISLFVIVSYLTSLSFGVFLYYFENKLNLPYADAISRLDIARKVLDNITPGLPQLGNVWLPLPQLLMLPFIGNNFMWHSGLAGYIMSGSVFIIGGLFIYKSAYLLTKSSLASLLSLSIYALNINILYLQTTAMSESIFLCSIAAVTYFFLRWEDTRDDKNVIFAALSASAMTLIRYEGLAILLSSVPVVIVYAYLKNRNRKRTEGIVILYSVVAFLGFGLWTLYLTVIFGDPLYWKTYYATPQATGAGTVAFTQAKPFLAAVWQYFTSFVWMIGIIPTIYAVIGTIIMLIITIRKRNFYFLALLMPLSIFLFMVLTLMRNTPIVQPDLTIQNIMSGKTSLGTGFNIRYGLLLLPWVALMSVYVFNIRFSILKILLFLPFFIQIYSYFVPAYSVIYQLPARINPKPFATATNWMKKNYDGGKILISAGSQEDQMFLMGFDYKTYIHEGTGKYWKESVDNPSRYAKWVVIDYGHNSDNVAKQMNREDILEREYKVVYEEKELKIFKKITKPYFDIP